jgi:hypothetical protein
MSREHFGYPIQPRFNPVKNPTNPAAVASELFVAMDRSRRRACSLYFDTSHERTKLFQALPM